MLTTLKITAVPCFPFNSEEHSRMSGSDCIPLISIIMNTGFQREKKKYFIWVLQQLLCSKYLNRVSALLAEFTVKCT